MQKRNGLLAAALAGVCVVATPARAQVAAHEPAARSSWVEPLASSWQSAAHLRLELRFDQQRKSPFAALAIEILPGAGSLYADDAAGAFLTWGLMIGGTASAALGTSLLGGDEGRTPDHPAAMPLLLGGLALAVAGRIYGFVNACNAAARYNAALRHRLGLAPEPTSPPGGR